MIGQQFFTAPGGKGANQAVAVAKLGVSVHLVGQVGGDSFGTMLLEALKAVGVGTEGVVINAEAHSGVASIVVERAGDNAIACAAGANARVGKEDVGRFAAFLDQAKVVLLGLEIPLEAVVEAATLAHRRCTVILDPAPVRRDLPQELYPLIDIMTPNEVEASQLVNFTVDSPATAEQAAFVLQQRGVSTVVVTLGSQGAVCCTPEETFWVPAVKVQAVDTVAAGDAFNGGLAAALDQDKSIREAVYWGTVAGALSATKRGAQSSLPDRDSFTRLLSSIKRSN